MSHISVQYFYYLTCKLINEQQPLSEATYNSKFLYCYSHSLTAIILATLSSINVSMFSSQPQISIKVERNKEFNESCLFATFKIKTGNIADCLEHALSGELSAVAAPGLGIGGGGIWGANSYFGGAR